ncbi:MAG: CDP-diacylglycerol--serine O-phosphatidyltransferase [Barnesiella sp.]|nr:CDP-diacylglycerol--serine O-phosphatidyltransferase [Barnesiella sp.]MBD5344851.1 CDP-diacylglycerol--serine O-phosphatidyltransferase [Bacteroides sp.]
MIKKIISCIPNTITCLNLLSGAMAVILSFHLTESYCGLSALSLAFIFIGAAAVFDFCDGAAARLLKAYSAMGKELDSLSDLVSFGLAPSMLIFNTMQLYGDGAWSFAALFIPAMGALRLAKFNIDDRQTTSFLGLPIPANAIFWVGALSWFNSYVYPSTWVMIVLIAVTGLLMVSNIPMFSLKFKNFAFAENLRRYILILATVIFVIGYGVAGLAWTIVFYLVLSLIPERKAVND